MANFTKYHCLTSGFLHCIRLVALTVFLAAPQGLMAQCSQDYFWAVWSNFTGNSATGTITTNNGPIEVTMTANYNFDSTPNIFNYPAFNGFGGNAPPNATVPRTTWTAGQGGETTMCFSETVTNPILLISSLGNPGTPVTLTFSRSYQVLFNGGGMTFPNDLTVIGQEGYCILLFPGEFDCVTIFSSTPENYTNITWGLSPHLFEVEITGEPEGCDSTTLTASGGITYQWSGGNTPNSPTNTFTTSGNYFLTVTDADGCTVVTSVEVDVHPPSFYTFSENICEGESYLFNGVFLTESGQYEAITENQFGCDSTTTLNLQVNPVDLIQWSQSICEGQWAEFNGNFVNEPGVYTETLQNQYGCDSTLHFTLEVFPTDTADFSITLCDGETYSFNGEDIGASGNYSAIFANAYGCDSLVNLSVEVYPVSFTEFNETICEGEVFFFEGNPITQPGVYTEVQANFYGCDSLITLVLDVLPAAVDTTVASICEGDAYLFFGQNYSNAGVHRYARPGPQGCDSISILELTVLPADSTPIQSEICAGQRYLFNGTMLDTSGIYLDTLQNALGCDSIITLTLTVRPFNTTQIANAICFGESYVFDGQTITSPGTYQAVFTDVNGCDSTVTLNLQVNPLWNTPLQVQICDGQTYSFNNQQLTTAGVYLDTLQSQFGCDSLLTLNLDVVGLILTQDSLILCPGETYTFGNLIISSAGVYRDTLISSGGCDSVSVLRVDYDLPTQTPLSFGICQGETYTWGNQMLNAAGIYYDTLSNRFGCDSILTLTLDIWPEYTTQLEARICEGQEYVFYGRRLTQPGLYSETLSSGQGCDSVLVLDLSVDQTLYASFEVAICEGERYTFGGIDRQQPGMYYDTLQASGGCDSIVELTLRVNPLERTELSATICEGQFYRFAGDSLWTSGRYEQTLRTAQGCDSLVVLNLATLPSQIEEWQVISCDQYRWPVNGVEYTASGIYTFVTQNQYGCDSSLILNLSIRPSHFTEEWVEAPNYFTWPVNGKTYYSSGDFQEDYQSSSGCDSVHVLHLVIKEVNPVFVPNVFTPNRDGINDRFTIYGDAFLVNIETLTIYDRWGNKLADYQDLPPNDPSYGWDGSHREKEMDPAVFIFTARVLLLSGKTLDLHGEVHLLR
jgi:gliding motility-associated-like protein